MKLFVKMVIGAVACLGSVSAHAVTYQLTNLGSINQFERFFDINESGQIAGTVIGASGFSEAAVWSNGGWTLLNPGVRSFATGINDHGVVVGASLSGGELVATVWKDGAAQLLPRTNALSSEAHDINNAGQIVGSGTASDSLYSYNRPALWSNGSIQYLEGVAGWASTINDKGQIAGSVQTGNDPFSHATVWRNGKAVVLDEGMSDVYGINNHGTIVGSSSGTGAVSWGQDADPFVAGRAYFANINDGGVAVGSADFGFTGWGSQRAMIWRDGQAYDLNELVVGGLDSRTLLRSASAINERGQIVGFAENLGAPGYQAFLLTPVPEPEHWAMLLVGLGLVGVAARRKA